MLKTQKIIEINVQEPYLNYIANGIKTVEGRLNKGKFKEAEIGDIIVISGIEKNYIITSKNLYSTFLEMVTNEGFKKVIPDKKDEIGAAEVYYKFFTKEQESEFGVVAIEIEEI
jgi:ASC-1-like (ASCH) protein